jgi:predicted MPP superfamily phosphohydrolase
MKARSAKFPIALAAIAALAVALVLSWFFSRQGTIGLFEWHPPWRRNFILIGLAGLLPLGLGLFSSLLRKGAMSRARRILAAATIALSALAILLAGGLLAYVLSNSRSLATPLPAVKLIDPSVGIRASGGGVRISLSSDPHWGVATSDAEARKAVIQSVAAAIPRRDAFLILGDNVEMGMEDSGWREEALELSSLLGGVPARALLGNHDGLIDGQYHFEKYFFPSPMKTDSGSPFYYSMSAGPAVIVALNLLWGAESFTRAQAAWLEKTLSAISPGKQVIVISHCFFYASGYDDEYGYGWYDMPSTIARVAPILERHRVALVVSGHDHYMELLKKNGVTYAVIGTMGGLLDAEPSHHSPASIWYQGGVYGRLDLDIGAAGIALAFRDRNGASLREDFIPATQ